MKLFLGVTVHWIDREWNLRNTLLDLAPLYGPHTGVNLCAAFESVCADFGVLEKLLAVTTDNAASNNRFITQLESDCLPNGIEFRKGENHVRCVAHVINLAVQALLQALRSEPPDSEEDFLEVADSGLDLSHCVQRLRRLVVNIRGSPQRREKFEHQCERSQVQAKELPDGGVAFRRNALGVQRSLGRQQLRRAKRLLRPPPFCQDEGPGS